MVCGTFLLFQLFGTWEVIRFPIERHLFEFELEDEAILTRFRDLTSRNDGEADTFQEVMTKGSRFCRKFELLASLQSHYQVTVNPP